jgi:hypothetical protein
MSLPLHPATPPAWDTATGTAMRTETAIDRVKRDLHCVLDNVRDDLDRIDILSAALSAFSKPVPDYEPTFQHMRHLMLNAHELG